ncbi:MAG: HEAT repeat domain-containing protein, partial [Thermodesulfobacteriota bacterium]
MLRIELLLIASSAFFSILAVSFLSIVLIRMMRKGSSSRAENQVKRSLDLSGELIESGSSVNRNLLETLMRMGNKTKIETYLDGAASVHGVDLSRLGAYYDATGVTQRYLDILLHSTSWKKRAFAAEKLGRIGSGGSVPILLSVVRNVKDEDEDVRGAALRALGRIRDDSAIPFLIQALGSPETWLPPRIGEILVNIGPAAISPLIKELKNIDSENSRTWAAEILGWLEAKTAVLPLVESLSDISPEVRAKAAGSLGKLKDDRALGRLLELLVSEPVPFVRVRVAQALGSIGNPSVVDHLINILKDPEWWVRVRTVEALEYLGDKAVSALLIALEDDDPEVQRRASMALERIGYIEKVLDEYGQEKFRPDLRKILFRAAKAGVIESIREKMKSADLQLQKNIVRILGEAGVKESSDLLLDALKKSPDWTLKARIVQSLGKVGAKSALPNLLECLKDEEYWVRKSAVDAIALLEGKEAGDRIAGMLSDPNPYARQAALNALLKLKISDYRDRIEALLNDPSPEVKSTAIHVMADMGFPIPQELCLRFLTESYEEGKIEIIRYLSKGKNFSLTAKIMRLLPISSQALRKEIIRYVTQMESAQFSTLIDPLDPKSLPKEILCSLIEIASIVCDEPAVRFVMEFTDHLDAMLRTAALRALQKMKPKGHEAIFEKALADPSDEVRVTALAVISSTFDVKTLSRAKHMLEDPSTDIRLALALAYGASGASAFKEKLSSLFSSDPSAAVRAGALVSLACVNGSLSA